MRKRLFGIMASVVVIVAACGGASTSTAPSAPPAASTAPGTSAAPASVAPSAADMADEQVLHIDLATDPPTLDPTKAQDSVSIEVLQAITRPLVYFDKDLKVVPAIAEKWEFSADGKTLTYHLRDAKYSNGDPIVAADFVYSWKRLVDPRLAAPYNYIATEIAGAPELLALAGAKPAPTDAQIDALLAKVGVAAPDPKTFVVTLNTPATYFLTATALWPFSPIQEKWITQKGATEAENYVASGPFMLAAWKHNSQVVLKPNPNWYGDKPHLTEIDASVTPEPAQQQASFEAGELDMVLPPTEDLKRIQGDPVLGPQVLQVPTFGITYYDFNNFQDPKMKNYGTPGPTANKDFRIALSQAIDKKAFIDATYSGVGSVANSIVMPGIPGYDEALDPYPYDLASAKDHMTKALAALGKSSAADLGKLTIGFNTGSGHEAKVAFLAEAWRQAFGLETEQVGSEWSVFLTARTAGTYDISRDAWGADYPHANNQLNGLFTCGGGNNNSQYCSKDFDALLVQAATEPDQDKAASLYKQAQKLMIDDAAVLPLRFGLQTYEVAPYVGGIQASGTDSQLPGDKFFETMYIKKH
jgi:oligopeptide transport system substrate-binding protein